MKILLAHNNLRVNGGAEVFFLEIGRVLSANGHQVTYFCSNDESSPLSEWSEYFPQVANYNQGNLLSRATNFPRMVYNLKAKASMSRLIRDFKPDLIHVFAVYVQLTPSILDAAREAGVPVVMSCNDYKLICPNYKLYHSGHLCEECRNGKFYRAILNRCCHGSRVYSIASAIEAYIHSWLNIYRKNVHTFLFASEFMAHKTSEFWGEKTFNWRMLRNPFNIPSKEITRQIGDYALYFGRLIDEKGVNILLEAAALVPKVPVIIVGDGPNRAQLEIQASSLGLSQVKFVGPKWGEELNHIIQKCRFVVVPSLWNENFPYVILQAFAMGKPVVGSRRGGIPELIEHGKRGLLYDATDVASLAAAMETLMNDTEKASELGEAARHYLIEEFSDESISKQLIQIYSAIIG